MTDKKVEETEPAKATFHFIKSGDFRTIHMDGAIGSKTPSGHIHCAIYSERPAIPRIVTHVLDGDGALVDGGDHVVDGKSGYVRELQADLVLSTEVAQSLVQFLNNLLEDRSAMPESGETLQ